jgi:hypothetical protein
MSSGEDFFSGSCQVISNIRFLQRDIPLVFVFLHLCHGLSRSLLRFINDCVSPFQKHYRICVQFYCCNLFLADSDLRALFYDYYKNKLSLYTNFKSVRKCCVHNGFRCVVY